VIAPSEAKLSEADLIGDWGVCLIIEVWRFSSLGIDFGGSGLAGAAGGGAERKN